MITILPAFAACAYIPQLVRRAFFLLVKGTPPMHEAGALQQSCRCCTHVRTSVLSLNIIHGMGHWYSMELTGLSCRCYAGTGEASVLQVSSGSYKSACW